MREGIQQSGPLFLMRGNTPQATLCLRFLRETVNERKVVSPTMDTFRVCYHRLSFSLWLIYSVCVFINHLKIESYVLRCKDL